MSLNDTPSADRIHIGIFGRTNAGKSSLINSLINQDKAIVSDVPGTTTDPVSKAMELLPLGPVLITDTPGIDDNGELGKLRIQKSYQVLNRTDLAIVVIDTKEPGLEDQKLIEKIREKEIPYILVINKCDSNEVTSLDNAICVSAKTGYNINELKELIGKKMQDDLNNKRLIGDLIKPGDQVVLVVPIDKAAPKGRLILPQQMTIRDILDSDGIAITVKEDRLRETLDKMTTKPRMVVTDSQAFATVKEDTPEDIELTSFSILMARYKGYLDQSVNAVKVLKTIEEGDKILIAEGCTHHRQCGDIGTEKLPKWIREYTKVNPQFEFVSGGQFPEDLTSYKLVVHCGGCMLNEKEMRYRSRTADEAGVPMVNYGILISEMNGILERAIKPFS